MKTADLKYLMDISEVTDVRCYPLHVKLTKAITAGMLFEYLGKMAHLNTFVRRIDDMNIVIDWIPNVFDEMNVRRKTAGLIICWTNSKDSYILSRIR